MSNIVFLEAVCLYWESCTHHLWHDYAVSKHPLTRWILHTVDDKIRKAPGSGESYVNFFEVFGLYVMEWLYEVLFDVILQSVFDVC